MVENDSTTNAASNKSSKMNPVAPFVIGGIIIFLVVGLAIQFFAKKTGVQTNLEDIEIGGEKLPDTFPQDFPIYPGAKIVSSVSSNDLLVTFTASDGLDKAVPFYKNGLDASGWTIISSFDSDTLQTWAIAKGTTEGSVSITTFEREPMTIVVTLGEKE